jgi:hypothetical protein
MGEAAAIASIASLSLTVAGSITKGSATKAANDFQADRLTRAAEFGKMQATLTDTTDRENLNTTLGNIESVRAAANIDPTSPTTAALMDQSSDRSDRQRMAAVGSLRAQSAEDLASADYLRKAGDFAVTQSYLSAGTDILSGIAKGASAFSGSTGSSGTGFSLVRTGGLY